MVLPPFPQPHEPDSIDRRLLPRTGRVRGDLLRIPGGHAPLLEEVQAYFTITGHSPAWVLPPIRPELPMPGMSRPAAAHPPDPGACLAEPWPTGRGRRRRRRPGPRRSAGEPGHAPGPPLPCCCLVRSRACQAADHAVPHSPDAVYTPRGQAAAPGWSGTGGSAGRVIGYTRHQGAPRRRARIQGAGHAAVTVQQPPPVHSSAAVRPGVLRSAISKRLVTSSTGVAVKSLVVRLIL